MTSYNSSRYGDEGQLMDAAIRANKSFYMEIQRLKDRMKWRAVADCRPPFDESIEFAEPTRVLAWRNGFGNAVVACYSRDEYGEHWTWDNVGRPTHWMPLPEPPNCTTQPREGVQ
jgi:hypothetical protein